MLWAPLLLALLAAATARADWASGSEELSGSVSLESQVQLTARRRRRRRRGSTPPLRLAQHPQSSLPLQQGIRIILNPSKPKLTVVSTAAVCGDGTVSSACSGQFLMTALHKLYEVDASGKPVNERDAGDVLNLSQVWGAGRGSRHAAACRGGGRAMPLPAGAGRAVARAVACAYKAHPAPPRCCPPPAGHLGSG